MQGSFCSKEIGGFYSNDLYTAIVSNFPTFLVFCCILKLQEDLLNQNESLMKTIETDFFTMQDLE
jgi:hypothetical protein